MASAAWLGSALAAADAAGQALGLEETVQRSAFIQDDGFGEATRAPAVPLLAFVERRQGQRARPGGQEVSFRATVAFPRPVTVDPRDEIRLADGFTGPIVDIERAPIDAETGAPFAVTVFLG
jgi:hypothetical protein